MYNIHPIIVHFPVALLFIYSVVKIIPFGKWFPEVKWRHIERVLLTLGVLGAFGALLTGDAAKHLFGPNHDLVEAHEMFASISTYLYCALLLGELASILNVRPYFIERRQHLIGKISHYVESIFCHKILSRVIAFVALVSIIVTGMLGGVMVYGLTADPLAGIVLKILGISI